MSDSVIKVEGLSKRYRIGVQEKADTFAEQLKNSFTYPIKNFKKIAGMTKFKGHNDPSEFWALRDLNFEVKRGEVLGIIGHNGAGKSTLLKILSRITDPTTGRIEIEGRVSALLEVGTGFHPELTGRDNIYMNGTILGMRKREIDQKLDEIVAFSGVEKHLDTPVKFYSSGMRVRLAFSVAAHLEPEILIIDEVLAVGDAEFQKKCLGKMEDVAETGRTVLFVSHNMNAVRGLCSDLMLLKKGGISYQGGVSIGIQRYLGEDLISRAALVREDATHHKNESAQLLSIIVLQMDRTPVVEPLCAADSFLIEFQFKIFEADRSGRLDVTFHLLDEMNNNVFVSSTAHYVDESNIKDNIFMATCEMPSNLLHEGRYRLGRTLLVLDRGVVLLEVKDSVYFDVFIEDNGFGWKGQKAGVVRPKLTWDVKWHSR